MWQSLLCLFLTCSNPQIDVLRGETIKVSSVLQAPFLMYSTDSQNGTVKYEGFLVDMLEEMEKILGAKFQIQLAKDGGYGKCLNESVKMSYCEEGYNGMIGEVMRHEVDLAVADLEVMPDRLLHVDFTTPFMSGGTVLVARKEDPDNMTEIMAKAGEEYLYLVKAPDGNFDNKFGDESTVESIERTSSILDEMDKLMLAPGQRYVLIREKNMADYYVAHDCNLKIVGADTPINTMQYAIAMAKGASVKTKDGVQDLRTVLDYAVSLLQINGKLDGIRKKWWTSKC